MSLSDRLRKIEDKQAALGRRVSDLAEACQQLAQLQQELVEALPEDDEPELELDLDGNVYGGERDTSQSLDG